MFGFVRTVAFYILRSLKSAGKCHMTPFLAVVVLGYTWVYICNSDSCYIASNIEAPVDQASCLALTLYDPYIKLYNGYIQFGGNLNNMRF